MPDTVADTADIDGQLTVPRENRRKLIEQPVTYYGAAADDDRWRSVLPMRKCGLHL
jgi:hypothetical protein